jgi:hypothetical protein
MASWQYDGMRLAGTPGATGKVEWDTKVPNLPLGAATVSNDLVFTTLYNGELLALNPLDRGDRLPAETADVGELPHHHHQQCDPRPRGRPGHVSPGRRRQPPAGGLHRVMIQAG